MKSFWVLVVVVVLKSLETIHQKMNLTLIEERLLRSQLVQFKVILHSLRLILFLMISEIVFQLRKDSGLGYESHQQSVRPRRRSNIVERIQKLHQIQEIHLQIVQIKIDSMYNHLICLHWSIFEMYQVRCVENELRVILTKTMDFINQKDLASMYPLCQVMS